MYVSLLGLRPQLSEKVQSYQAYMLGQAGPDNPYRFGVTSSKYVRHLAKVAPVGRSAATALPADSLLNLAVSPYESSYT